jgi:hypothetical protein
VDETKEEPLKVVEEGVQTDVGNESERLAQTKDEAKVLATRANVVEQEEPAKPLTGLRQKFFGIPVWLYLGFGLFIGAVFVIAVVAR